MKLKEIYAKIESTFPEESHDRNKFYLQILTALKKDPLRTSGLRRELNLQGLEYDLSRNFPKNDFFRASLDYMLSVGIKREDAETFLKDSVWGNLP